MWRVTPVAGSALGVLVRSAAVRSVFDSASYDEYPVHVHVHVSCHVMLPSKRIFVSQARLNSSSPRRVVCSRLPHARSSAAADGGIAT